MGPLLRVLIGPGSAFIFRCEVWLWGPGQRRLLEAFLSHVTLRVEFGCSPVSLSPTPQNGSCRPHGHLVLPCLGQRGAGTPDTGWGLGCGWLPVFVIQGKAACPLPEPQPHF